MPVHFFTLHAHGSWSPEKSPQQELFERDRFGGLCQQFRVDPRLRFTADHQRKLVDALIDAQQSEVVRCFGVAANRERVHALIAWEGDRRPEEVRREIAAAITREMNEEFGPRGWLSQTGRDKRVRNRTHFDYLISTFFPKQRGLVWTYVDRRPVRGRRLAVA